MPPRKLDDDHHIVRYVPFSKLRKDEDDNVIGVLWTAFQRRESEDTLSGTWLEYFAGERDEMIARTVRAIRASNIDVRPKSGFAIGRVDAIREACATKNHQIRILHEPEDDNHAHAVVRRLPRDDEDLLELIANTAWAEVVLNSTIPSGAVSAPLTAAT